MCANRPPNEKASGRPAAPRGSGPRLLRIDGSGLPNEVSAVLPRAGTYYVLVSALPGRGRFEGDYCVTLESSQQASQTFTQAW